MNPPRTMGHEIVGEVVAVGPDAKAPRSAERQWSIRGSAVGKCWYCTNGIEHLCPTPRALGVNNDGGYADHVLVPHAKYLYPYGDIPTELACLYACSGITASARKKAVGPRRRQAFPGDRAGGVGLMGVRFAKAVLGHEPIVADIDRSSASSPGKWRDRAFDPREKDARKQVQN